MRRFLSPRWLLLHLLMVISFTGCLALGWWQLTRAEGGNALSWGYTFEWPVFALFAVAFWGRLVRDERRRHRPGPKPEPPRLRTPVLSGAPAGRPRSRSSHPGTDDRVPEEPAAHDTADRPAALSGAREQSTRDGDDELASYNRYLAWQSANPHRGRRDYPG